MYRVAAGTESLDIINENTGGSIHPTTKNSNAAMADDKQKHKKSVNAVQQQEQLQQHQLSINGDVDMDNDYDATSRKLTTTNNGLSQNGVNTPSPTTFIINL